MNEDNDFNRQTYEKAVKDIWAESSYSYSARLALIAKAKEIFEIVEDKDTQ